MVLGKSGLSGTKPTSRGSPSEGKVRTPGTSLFPVRIRTEAGWRLFPSMALLKRMRMRSENTLPKPARGSVHRTFGGGPTPGARANFTFAGSGVIPEMDLPGSVVKEDSKTLSRARPSALRTSRVTRME